MTAEGDNRVLYQKVAKELLSRLRKGKHTFAKTSSSKDGINWDCPTSVQQILVAFEKQSLMDLASTMQRKTMKEKKPLFEVWMNEDQDKVQVAAEAYSLRVVGDAALRCVAEECRTEGMKALMKQCTLLSQYADISKWFGYLVGHRIVDVDDGEVLREKMNALCAKMAPMSLSVCEAFGVPEKLMPPIAMDWIEYNQWDNNGEILLQHPLKP